MKLRESDYLAISHVARYRLTINEVLHRQVFPASACGGRSNGLKDAGEARTALARNGYLKDRHGGERYKLPGHHSFCTLGEKSLKLFPDLPKSVVQPPGPQALALNLSVLWFCCMKRRPAYRLSGQELERVLPGASALANNVVHCLRQESDVLVLYRIYLATGRNPRRSGEQVVKHLQTAMEHDGSRRMVHSGEYGIAVLAPTAEAAKGIREAVAHTLKQHDVTASLGVLPRITVEVAPVPETLGFAIGEYKRALKSKKAGGNGAGESLKPISDDQ